MCYETKISNGLNIFNEIFPMEINFVENDTLNWSSKTILKIAFTMLKNSRKHWDSNTHQLFENLGV